MTSPFVGPGPCAAPRPLRAPAGLAHRRQFSRRRPASRPPRRTDRPRAPGTLDLRGDRRPGLPEPVQHPERVAVVVADRPERRVAPVPPADAVPASRGSLSASASTASKLHPPAMPIVPSRGEATANGVGAKVPGVRGRRRGGHRLHRRGHLRRLGLVILRDDDGPALGHPGPEPGPWARSGVLERPSLGEGLGGQERRRPVGFTWFP